MIGEPLDVIGANVYYASQSGLELPGADELDPQGAPIWIGWSGPAYVQLLADIARGMKQAPFLVTETNATTIGSSADEFVPWPGQLRQVVYLLLARGAGYRALALPPTASEPRRGGRASSVTTCSRAGPIGRSCSGTRLAEHRDDRHPQPGRADRVRRTRWGLKPSRSTVGAKPARLGATSWRTRRAGRRFTAACLTRVWRATSSPLPSCEGQRR